LFTEFCKKSRLYPTDPVEPTSVAVIPHLARSRVVLAPFPPLVLQPSHTGRDDVTSTATIFAASPERLFFVPPNLLQTSSKARALVRLFPRRPVFTRRRPTASRGRHSPHDCLPGILPIRPAGSPRSREHPKPQAKTVSIDRAQSRVPLEMSNPECSA